MLIGIYMFSFCIVTGWSHRAAVSQCKLSILHSKPVSADKPARMQELYPNGSSTDIYFEDYFPYPIWRDEEMHALLSNAAVRAADAIATSGRPARTGQHVLLRMDLVMMTLNSKVRPTIAGATLCGYFPLIMFMSLHTVGRSEAAGVHADTEVIHTTA